MLLVVPASAAAQLLTVSPCNVLDERPEALETSTQAFDECVAFLRTNRPYWREGVPKAVVQHFQLLRGHLYIEEYGEAERIHRKAMDLFSALVDTPSHSITQSTLASAMIADYLVLSQRLRIATPRSHPSYPKIEAEAYAEPLAVLTRVMDRRTMLTDELATRYRIWMRKGTYPAARQGKVLVPSKVDLPLRKDPVETVLVGVERRVEEYLDDDRAEDAAYLVERCRKWLGPPGKPKGRYWIRVERRLRKLAKKVD
jgi:hypothetical protein